MISGGNPLSIGASKHPTMILVGVQRAAEEEGAHNKAGWKLVSYYQGIRH